MNNNRTKQLKTAAKVSLVLLLFSIVAQFIAIHQASNPLDSPLIPKDAVWNVSKHYIFIAFVLTISCIIGLIMYFYEKYLWVIILVVLTLIISRFIYLP